MSSFRPALATAALRFAPLLLLLSAGGTVVASLAAPAAWNADPAVNTVLSDRPGEQVQPKIAPLADGGAYLSWYDNAAGGYDPTLQRIDAHGDPQWAPGGLRVADTGLSWVTDYGLAADTDGDALLAFRDDRSGSEQITAARIAPDGRPLWGADGRKLSDATEFVGPPRITSTSDDRVVVGWSEGALIRLRRLGLDGEPLWPADLQIADAAAQLFLADLRPAPEGGFIASWVRTAGFSSPRHLYAQRFSADGVALWGEMGADGRRLPVPVFTASTLQYGNFPPFIPDGRGGAVFVWYETGPLQARAQRLDSEGHPLWGPNGLTAAVPDPGVERVEPAGAFARAAEDVYVFWRETPVRSGPYQQALRGQRIDGEGRRAWGEAGLILEDWGPHEMTQLNAAAVEGGVLFAWVEKLAEGDQRVWARKLSAGGADLWAPRVAVSSASSAKSRLTLGLLDGGMAVLGWQDTRGGSEDLYLQNLNRDGSLGDAGRPTSTPGGPGATPTAVATTPEPSATAAIGGWLFLPLLRGDR